MIRLLCIGWVALLTSCTGVSSAWAQEAPSVPDAVVPIARDVAVPGVSLIGDDTLAGHDLASLQGTPLTQPGPDGVPMNTLEVLTASPLPDGQAPAEPAIGLAPTLAANANFQDAAASADGANPPPAGPVVHTDYLEAMTEAVEDRKMLFIYFFEEIPNAATQAFDSLTLADKGIQEQLNRYVVARLPRDAAIEIDGQPVTLLAHPAFAEMKGRQGVVIIDLAHVRAEYYGRVVSTFAFTPGKYYRKEALSIILDLPPGTLTQRTMIYAVRIHPEAPASTQGVFHTVLADEAKSHSSYQAAVHVQGHHSWDTRFHRISAQLNGSLPQEVVAESWPNEDLVEACVDCVHSWRQSPGHWGAVRSRHGLFGYDIKRGRNGIWYATGIFGRRW